MRLTRRRTFSLLFAFALLALGLWLRTSALEHMEYKEDEEYNFVWSQMIGNSKPWPAWGMPSGVYVPNPGMSVWTFAGLAKLSNATEPVPLAQALAVFSVLGIALCGLLGFYSRDRGVWFWASALALVNPIQVMYQRKLWPQGFLPVFVALTLAGWWNRSRPGWKGACGAALWGFVGALLGQIHMSGFFVAFALFLVTWISDSCRTTDRYGWFPIWLGPWLVGSALGALPLIPWGLYAWSLPPHPAVSGGWEQILQFRYWAFLFTNPWGLHVGNSLGLLRGSAHWQQLADFARYPLLGGQATYAVAIAHGILVLLLAVTFLGAVHNTWRGTWRRRVQLNRPELILFASFVLLAGLLMSATGVSVRRYYLMIAFPVDTLLLVYGVRFALARFWKQALVLIWGCQLLISAQYSSYVADHEGSRQGDYGLGYAAEMKQRLPYGPEPLR